ncbi:MAG: amino acid adenylation domain-containing protein, partial [Methylococcaceae bacterium]|nr:amino acid adenylation domain-containing protein [Methylococcaceae bacterium]
MRCFNDSGLTTTTRTTGSNLVELLQGRAETQPEQTAYLMLGDGENASGHLTYAGLDRSARAIAARLQAMEMAGERVLLLYPPGLDYIEAFFGSLYAGAIAVPAYPPTRQHLPRLRAILRDAAPAAILSTAELASKLQSDLGDTLFGANERVAEWLATDTLGEDGAKAWTAPSLSPKSLAFLQYTSGSTGDPKGVMVSHGNLLANQEAIRHSFGHQENSTVVGWLPFYHDMGLIGNILQPLYIGSSAVLMPPMAFLEKPMRWLKAISDYGAATSGGPNFAYELCVRKVTAEQKRDLDLSSWSLAFNGSESVRAATLERFALAFVDCGFRRESFYPCYGLAEATLFVTGGRLEGGESIPAGETAALNPPLSGTVPCGLPWIGHEIRIVDPNSRQLCQPGQEGEIWVAGPSVAQGYWNRPEESESTFRASLHSPHPLRGEGLPTFLRTGDLGLLDGGRLCITGRIKDLIILRGRNVYPQDIEQVLTDSLESLRPGGTAAFSVTLGDEEGLVVVAELSREAMRKADYEAIFSTMRRRLAEAAELSATELVLMQPGGVPKTSSGKLRRQACKQAYLQGSLPVLASGSERESALARQGEVHGGTQFQLLREALAIVPPAQRAPLIARFLRSELARLMKISESGVSVDAPLRAAGLDSLKAVELKHAMDELLGIETPLSLFLSDWSVTAMAAALADEAGATNGAGEEASSSPGLSATQMSLWTMQHMEPGSIVYNLHLAFLIDGVDPKSLRRSFVRLMERHEMLRTLYRLEGDAVVQTLLAPSELPEFFTTVDASVWSETELQEELAQRVREPFDLAQGPLLRAILYRQGSGPHTLLLCAHHIAVDLWSILILIDELGKIHAESDEDRDPTLSMPVSSYADFAAWQRRYLESSASHADRDYWRRQLAGELPILALPTDRPRPAAPDYRGASLAIRLGWDETIGLKTLAERSGVTLFTLLLAMYKVLLHRYTQQNDLIIGVPTAGRNQARFASVVGNFVNPVPLRTRPSGEQSFATYLGEVHDALLGALEHQDYPFSLMVEDLQVERNADHWPVYQTLFVLQQAQAGMPPELAQLALGEDGPPLAWTDGSLHPLGLRRRIERFDLKLMAAEDGDGLLLSFQYRTDLFSEERITGIANHFRNLLQNVVANPATRLGGLSLLGEQERNRLLDQSVGPETPLPEVSCVHRLFETQAMKTPDLPALVCKDRVLSYGESNAIANRWAHSLRSLGIGVGSRVGISLERSSNFAIAILAVLKSGAAYVPLDPAYPEERLAPMLADAGIGVLLTQTGLNGPLPNITRIDMDRRPDGPQAPASDPQFPIPADSIAYVIYTSGSTGQSKGVEISHRSLLNYIHYIAGQIPAAIGLHYALVSTPAADLGNTVLFTSLVSGGCLHLFDQDTTTDGRMLADAIERQPIDVLKIVPSHLSALLDSAEGRNILPHRALICGGDVLSYDLVDRITACRPECRLFNHYGPTETTVGTLIYLVPPKRHGEERAGMPIGQPIANSRAYILDGNLEPVPAGIAGELYIGGAGLAQGYLNRPDLTAERFIPDPFCACPGERLYRTGDRVRRGIDGL